MPRKKSRPISNQKRKSLLNAYEEAFQNLPKNHPLRKARRKRRGESRGKLTKIKDGSFFNRFSGTDKKYPGPHYQGKVGPRGEGGQGTKDRMPGTRPTPNNKRHHPEQGKDTYIPTPFDKKKGKGYI